jgi:hypothetical protein
MNGHDQGGRENGPTIHPERLISGRMLDLSLEGFFVFNETRSRFAGESAGMTRALCRFLIAPDNAD